MSRKQDLTGQVFGRLTVESESRDKGGRFAWVCRCDCGNVTVVMPSNLKAGRAKSCGCKGGGGKVKDLAGKTFGMLTVIELKRVGRLPRWRCECSCGSGREVLLATAALTTSATKSCGCLVTAKKGDRSEEAKARKKTRAIWYGMIQRCCDTKHIAYRNYGGRGIRVCERWLESFENFLADMEPVPEGMELERRDPERGYEPDNCCWLSGSEQTNNRRNTVRLTFRGETKSLRDWATQTGIPYATLMMRVRHGWSVDDALLLPVGSRRTVTGEPESPQRKARHRVNSLLKSGRIVKPTHCQHPGCENTKVDGHHHRGYEGDAAVDVVWLCRTHHPLPRERSVTWEGRTQTLREWARETGLPRMTIYNRLVYRNWVVDESVFAPVWDNQATLITHDGVTMSIKAWAKHLGIGEKTISDRMKRGLTTTEVLAPTRYSATPVEEVALAG